MSWILKSMIELVYPGCYTDHGEEGDGPRGMVVDGNEVDEEGKATDQGREERGTKQHLLDPYLAYMGCMHVRSILQMYSYISMREIMGP